VEGIREWTPITADGWMQHSAFCAAIHKGKGDQGCLDDAICESRPNLAHVDGVSHHPDQARKSSPRVIDPRCGAHRRKHRPDPGQGTLFCAVGA
jgi:hypothetical protein